MRRCTTKTSLRNSIFSSRRRSIFFVQCKFSCTDASQSKHNDSEIYSVSSRALLSRKKWVMRLEVTKCSSEHNDSNEYGSYLPKKSHSQTQTSQEEDTYCYRSKHSREEITYHKLTHTGSYFYT